MMETELKALMYLGNFVDVNMLDKGIYACEKPFIYLKHETIEGLVERGKQIKDMTGANFISESYFENLQKCELVTVYLTHPSQVKPDN